MSNITQAMIMAAGFGKRMLPLTKRIPKPLIEINDKSFIENILIALYESGIHRIIINTHYLADQLKACIRSFSIYSKLKIIFLYEKEILDSGGGVANALNLFDNKAFYRINGDIFWTGDIFENFKQNWDNKLYGLLGVVEKDLLVGYEGEGDFDLIENKLIKLNSLKKYVFTGIAIFHPRLFENLEKKSFSLFQNYIFSNKFVKNNILNNIYGIELKNKIYHADNPMNLQAIRKMLMNN